MSLPYTVTVKVAALRRKLTAKELVNADLTQHPSWKAPKPKCDPLQMFFQMCKTFDKNASLNQANYYTDLYAVSPEIEFDDVDPNNIMLHLGEIAKACGSKKADSGVMQPKDFCKDFHYFMMVKVYRKEDHHVVVDMHAPDGKTKAHGEYTTIQEKRALRPEQEDFEEFIWWAKKSESDSKRKEAGLMTASDFFA